MEFGGYGNAEMTVVAALVALGQTHRHLDDFLKSTDDANRPEIEAMISRGVANVAEARVVPGDVAMARARELVERKAEASQ